MTLKPTIRNGKWVWLPPPLTDLPYLSTASGKASDALKSKEKAHGR